jgi:LmbE family N-acetylglucosaminyl deacetylase
MTVNTNPTNHQAQYDAIYLSPHLDDAAFSCGGQIFMQTSAGQSILVVTVTAGDLPAESTSELAQIIHDRWQLAEDIVARRRAEDALACRLLGADYIHWDFSDCIYRGDPETGEPLYATGDALFGEVHPADESFLDQLVYRMSDLPPHNRLFLPLAAGHHVDHQLTRAAGERCFGTKRVLYYEDYPYVRNEEALRAVLQTRANPNHSNRWKPQAIGLNEAALEAKVAAVLAYESQLSTFFTGSPDVEHQIRAFAQKVLAESAEAATHTGDIPAGAERIWQHSH